MVQSNLEDVKIKLWECDKAGLEGEWCSGGGLSGTNPQYIKGIFVKIHRSEKDCKAMAEEKGAERHRGVLNLSLKTGKSGVDGFQGNEDWRGTYKNVYNRENKQTGAQLTAATSRFRPVMVKRTHLGLKLQVRHSKLPLDQPTQTDPDAAATSLRMCPCSYTAQTQVKVSSSVTYNSTVNHRISWGTAQENIYTKLK